jgi:hypothetical protein
MQSSGTGAVDLAALQAVSEAVEAGDGLPEVVRRAAAALDASLVLIDRSGIVLATATRSPADERSMMGAAADVEALELRVADRAVGQLRMRARGEPSPPIVKLVTTLVAAEVERVRAPERESKEALTAFLHQALADGFADRADVIARGQELGLDLAAGASVVVARAHAHVPVDDGWRGRVLTVAERGARSASSAVVAALVDRPDTGGAEVAVLVPGADGDVARRVAEAMLRELGGALPGHAFALGRSRVAADPAHLHRAGSEALLAANVATGDEDDPCRAFEAMGAYRFLLSAWIEEPGEVQRFYGETVEPLVAYDDQYETDLVRTVEAFLEADGNVAATAGRLFTHRHTVRYRLERVRELTGLDVGSTDGREKLSLGLKAMRVLGIPAPGGPATESGARGGRVPRR